jgi:hypothetical protein
MESTAEHRTGMKYDAPSAASTCARAEYQRMRAADGSMAWRHTALRPKQLTTIRRCLPGSRDPLLLQDLSPTGYIIDENHARE